MKKRTATEVLLADHKMIRKIMSDLEWTHPRFDDLSKTLHRIIVSHAWFEDEIFLPAFQSEPRLNRRFVDEIIQEHKDINVLLGLAREQRKKWDKNGELAYWQFKSILDAHFKKEEDGLFPIAEKILNSEGLNALGDEMERRKTDVRRFIDEIK